MVLVLHFWAHRRLRVPQGQFTTDREGHHSHVTGDCSLFLLLLPRTYPWCWTHSWRSAWENEAEHRAKKQQHQHHLRSFFPLNTNRSWGTKNKFLQSSPWWTSTPTPSSECPGDPLQLQQGVQGMKTPVLPSATGTWWGEREVSDQQLMFTQMWTQLSWAAARRVSPPQRGWLKGMSHTTSPLCITNL